ncbi:MAG: Holliday junction resolvase RuvX [Anaerolineales bacterium]|nr:Holliday junction resolvase RuvX [Anaerolineales bacterium]
MKVLAVDPGEVRIGLAISDPSGTLARPLQIIQHIARDKDAERVAAIAAEYEVERIVVGLALNEHGRPTRSGRKAARMAERLRGLTGLDVDLVEESFTTQKALRVRQEMEFSRKKKQKPVDAEAAAVILQGYLDERQAE